MLIDGFNFGDQQGSNALTIGGSIPQVVSWGSKRIAIKIPVLAPKRYPILVTTAAGQAKATFDVKQIFLLTEQGPCDDSFLGTLAGTCWVTVPIQIKQNSDRTVQVSVQNIRARWYEVTVDGTSVGSTQFLIAPNETVIFDSVTLGPEGKISFFADGESTRAIEMHIWDFLYIMVTGERMPTSLTDQMVEYVFGLCGNVSDICSFSKDLNEAWRSGSITKIVSVLARLPVVLASDPITEAGFLEVFKFSTKEAAWIGQWTTALGLLDLAYRVIGVQRQQVEYLIAPRFAKACLLTPNNAGTCQ